MDQSLLSFSKPPLVQSAVYRSPLLNHTTWCAYRQRHLHNIIVWFCVILAIRTLTTSIVCSLSLCLEDTHGVFSYLVNNNDVLNLNNELQCATFFRPLNK